MFFIPFDEADYTSVRALSLSVLCHSRLLCDKRVIRYQCPQQSTTCSEPTENLRSYPKIPDLVHCFRLLH